MICYTFLSEPTTDHLNRIIHLYRHAGWWSEKEADDPDLVQRIIEGSHCFLIAHEQNKIIGMGRAISDMASDSYIQDVIVDLEYRNHGIGSNILKKLVERLQTDGLKWIGLIAEHNSHKFYEPLGFKQMPNAIPMLNLAP